MKNKSIRFNIIDFVIIIAVLAIVAAVVVRQFIIPMNESAPNVASEIAFFEKENDVQYVKLVIEMKVAGIQEKTKDYIDVGDVVRDINHDEYARITNIKICPAKSFYVLETGEIKELDIPTRIDAFITMECVAKKTKTSIIISNDTLAAVSQQLAMNTEDVRASGTVLSIDSKKITAEQFNDFVNSLEEKKE